MNITLSADPAVIARAREYARRRNTTLNQLVREHLMRLTAATDAAAADEFARLAREHAGQSPEGFRFDRESTHNR